MIRTRACANDTIRLLVPNMDTVRTLPPGTVLEVTGHLADQPNCCLAVVLNVPDNPTEYHVVVPKGATVTVHEE